ncbi:MAG: ACP S-malonyltransferase [Candidatus Marinimicrobia bacterium]|nr:ACP S-malonyltransferase [Candidatus Neomarinimicrobiota bacterium]
MPSNILLFPGQGSQFVGMGLDIYTKLPSAKSYYKIANEILGVDIAEISFNGPEDLLRQTQNTQPAIFTHSICVFTYLKEIGISYDATAGHSLGEFTALVASGVLTFEDALSLVKVRSQEMAKAGKIMPGTMAAIIGADNDQIEKICQQDGVVVVANINAPGQIVISGEIPAISAAIETAKLLGVRRALPLNVSGAFHSPLMKPARIALSNTIESLSFNAPTVPIYQNATAQPVTDPEIIKSNLLLQLESPVRWVETIQNMKIDGHSSFIEIGPGKILQGLQKRIFPDSHVSSLGTLKQTEEYAI